MKKKVAFMILLIIMGLILAVYPRFILERIEWFEDSFLVLLPVTYILLSYGISCLFNTKEKGRKLVIFNVSYYAFVFLFVFLRFIISWDEHFALYIDFDEFEILFFYPYLIGTTLLLIIIYIYNHVQKAKHGNYLLAHTMIYTVIMSFYISYGTIFIIFRGFGV